MSAKDTSSTLLADFDKTTLNTQYCVELWQRDLQIEANLRRVPGRLDYKGDTDEPIAVVGYGPSLLHTWEEIRNFDKIITCSGALKFLLERNIIPTWHIEVDPRPHKALLMGAPHPAVEYLLASCTHPDVFDLLEAYRCHKVKLWHIFADEQFRSDQSYPFPKGEWMFTGGSNAGMRAMVLARFLGHYKQTVFGLDASFAPDRTQHAGFHPKEFDHVMVVPTRYGDYLSNPGMIQAARSFVHEISQIPNLELTLRGDGLIQAKMREHNELGNPLFHTKRTMLAMRYEKTISDEYLEQNKKLHETNPAYGVSGVKYAPVIKQLKEELKAETILDYGCGKSTLAKALPFPIWEYDPAIPGKDANPKPADLLVCTDVLEHIEPEYLDEVLKDLARCTIKKAYLVVSNVPAMKTLPDGRNTHLIVQPMDWWRHRISQYFDIDKTIQGGVVDGKSTTSKFICSPKTQSSPLVVNVDKDPKTMWVSDIDKTKLEPVTPKGEEVTVEGLPTITIEGDGTTVKFLNINDLTKWRAESFFTKEPATIRWIDDMERGGVFYDVGANMGGYSVWASARRGMEVYAFEPESGNYALLCRNFVINSVKGEAFCIAVTDKPTIGRLFTSNSEVGGSCHSFNVEVGPDLKPRHGVAQGCMGHSIDDLVNAGLPMPNYIKIDVDGFEHKVIEGARRTLKRPELKGLIVEVNTNLAEHQKMIGRLAELGYQYDQAQVDASTRKDGPFKGCAEFIFTRQVNVADVRKAVIAAIMAAPVFKEPFEHIIIENVFPKEFYDKFPGILASTIFKPIEEVRGVRGYPERSVAAAPDSLKWMLDGVLREAMCLKFGVAGWQGYNDETLLIRDAPGYRIGPHSDSPAKVISALFYLPEAEIPNAGTSLYTPVKPDFRCPGGPHYPFEDFTKVYTVPFKPNTLFAFLKSDRSFHGVEPFRGPGERNLLLYDVRK